MRTRYGNDTRLLTDGYTRSLNLPGYGTIGFQAGRGKTIRHSKGTLQTGRLSFDDGQEVWAVFVDTADGFDTYCFVPTQIGNDLVRFDLERGFMGKPEWAATKCRYRLDGTPLHQQSAHDVNASGWSLRTLAEDARPHGLDIRAYDPSAVSSLVKDLSAGLGEAPDDRREIARRLRAASDDLLRQADLLEA